MRTTWTAVLALLLAAAYGPITALAQTPERLRREIERAEDDLEDGDYEDAIERLTKYADRNPSASAWLALAAMQMKVGTIGGGGVDAAAASAQQAVQAAQAPADRALALSGASYYEMMRGPASEALRLARDAVDAEENAVSLAALAKAQVRSQDYATAEQTARKAVAADARNVDAHVALGQALLRTGTPEDAVTAFRGAIELDPTSLGAQIGLCSALSRAGQHAEAVAAGREAVAAHSWSAEAYAALGLAILAEDPTDAEHLNSAIGEAQQGKFLNDRSVVAQLAVGQIFEARGDFGQAQLAYEQAAQVDPGYAPARVAAIQIQVRRQELAAALAAAKQLVQEVPNSAEAQLQLGRVLFRSNQFVESLPPLEKAAQLAPGMADAQALLGTAYQYNRRSEDAVEAYRKAVELDPENIDYRISYGLLLGMTGSSQEGVAQLETVIQNPGYEGADAWVNLGWIHRNSRPRNPDASVAAYEKALQLDPENGQAALGLGWAYSYVQPRQWDKAIAAFEKAIELDDSLAGEAWSGMGWVHFFNQDIDQAITAVQEARNHGRTDRRLAANIERVKNEQESMAIIDAYQSLENGMTYERVQEILGGPGEETDRQGDYVTYQWPNPDESYIVAVFEKGALIDRIHTGLEEFETEGGAESAEGAEGAEGEVPAEGGDEAGADPAAAEGAEAAPADDAAAANSDGTAAEPTPPAEPETPPSN